MNSEALTALGGRPIVQDPKWDLQEVTYIPGGLRITFVDMFDDVPATTVECWVNAGRDEDPWLAPGLANLKGLPDAVREAVDLGLALGYWPWKDWDREHHDGMKERW